MRAVVSSPHPTRFPRIWRDYLHNKDEDDDLSRIRREESGGRPIGTESFIKGLENKLKRSFDRGMPGRPRKNQK